MRQLIEYSCPKMPPKIFKYELSIVVFYFAILMCEVNLTNSKFNLVFLQDLQVSGGNNAPTFLHHCDQLPSLIRASVIYQPV